MGDTNSKTFESAVYTEEELAQLDERVSEEQAPSPRPNSGKLKRRASSKKNKTPEPPIKSDNNPEVIIEDSPNEVPAESVTSESGGTIPAVVLVSDVSKDNPTEGENVSKNSEGKKVDDRKSSLKKGFSFKKMSKKDKVPKKSKSDVDSKSEGIIIEDEVVKSEVAEDPIVLVPGVTVNDNEQPEQTPVTEKASSSPEKDSKKKDSKKKESKDAKDAKKQDSKDSQEERY